MQEYRNNEGLVMYIGPNGQHYTVLEDGTVVRAGRIPEDAVPINPVLENKLDVTVVEKAVEPDCGCGG